MSIKDDEIIILPTLTDHRKHYLNNNLSLIYVKKMSTQEEFVIGFDHSELGSLPIDVLSKISAKKFYTINQKYLLPFLNRKFVDMNTFYYLHKNSIPDWIFETPVHLYFERRFPDKNNLNRIIPVAKHIEMHQDNGNKIFQLVRNLSDPPALYSYLLYGRVIYDLETSGIKINPTLLEKYYPNSIPHLFDNKLYSDYNFYTATGRPSNAFAGLNFAAVSKTSGARKTFIPQNDKFLMFDFDSFHLNLIARILKYEFSEKNIHTYLGKFYFNKDVLTDDEYDEANRI